MTTTICVACLYSKLVMDWSRPPTKYLSSSPVPYWSSPRVQHWSSSPVLYWSSSPIQHWSSPTLVRHACPVRRELPGRIPRLPSCSVLQCLLSPVRCWCNGALLESWCIAWVLVRCWCSAEVLVLLMPLALTLPPSFIMLMMSNGNNISIVTCHYREKVTAYLFLLCFSTRS